MIPRKARAAITDALETYGHDIKMVVDDALQDGAHYILGQYGEPVELRGSTRFIAWARDVRDNAFVPECYDDAASTWG